MNRQKRILVACGTAIATSTIVANEVETILKEAGSNKKKVLQVRIYISNIDLWDKVNDRYTLFFEDHKPARCIIPTRELHFGCLIEIEVTALKKKD